MTQDQDNAAAIARWGAMPTEVVNSYDDQGDFSKRHLINSQLIDQLGSLAGSRVLDAGAGEGYLSRLLARSGAQVTAVEPAQALVDRIRELERAEPLGIEIKQADLAAFRADVRYDAVILSMVLQGIPDWRPALFSAVDALAPGGRLMITLNHPCFENLWSAWKREGAYRTDRYLTEYEIEGPYASNFHRPLSTYLNAIIETGCRIDRVIEPGLDPKVGEDSGIEGVEAYVELPNFVIISARRG